jgi:hypothetical protein
MSIVPRYTDSVVLSSGSRLPQATNLNYDTNIDHGSQITLGCPDDHAVPKKRTKSRLWRLGTRDSSKSMSSVRSLGQKMHAKLNRVISGERPNGIIIVWYLHV